MPTIFYSWQSDAPNRTNRGFIRGALDRAVKQLAADPDVEERPDVQQDTAGVAGAPDIANTIYERIAGPD